MTDKKRGWFGGLFSGSSETAAPYKKADLAPKPKRPSTEQVLQANALSKVLEDIDAAEKALAEREIEVRYSNDQMKNFKSFVRKAEIELQNSVRLADERNELSEEVGRLSQDKTELKTRLEQERARLAAATASNEKYRVALENARADIIRLMERDSDYREEIETLSSDLAKSDLERVNFVSAADNLRAERQVLKERLERTVEDLNSSDQRANELQKSYDAIADELKSLMERHEQVTAENSAAMTSLESFQAENAELVSQANNARLELGAQRRQYDEKIRIREEEIYSLRAKSNTAKSEARVTSQVLAQAQDDLALARSEVNASKLLAKDLRNDADKEKKKADQLRSQVSDMNAQISVMSVKYDAALVELETARKEIERLTRALKIESQRMEFVFDAATTESKSEEVDTSDGSISKGRGKPH